MVSRYPPSPSAPSYGTPGYREGDRIIDLIMAQGGIQAERAQRSGDIWSNAIGNIAEQFQGALGQIVENKKAAAMVRRDAAWVSFVESGEWQKDPKAGLTTALRIWGPQEGPKQFAGLEAVQKIGAGKPEEDAKHLGQVIGAVDPLGDDAKARWWPQLRALGAHVFPDVKIPEQYDPQMWPEITALGKQLRGEKPKELLKGNPGDVFLDPDTHQPVASIPSTPKEPKEYEVTVPGPNGQPVKKLVSREALAAGVRTYVEPKAEDAAPTLTPGALDQAARLWTTTGQLPPMGMGKSGATVRQAIMNRAAELSPDADIAGNKAGYGADAGSLRRLQAQTDAVSAFESTASKNAELLEGVLKKIPDAGTKVLNRPIRALAGAVGSEEIATFNAIRQSVQNEYSRIISNPNLSGVMSDSARHEGEALLSGALTVGQLRAALKVLAAEAKNRHTSYNEQLKQIKGRIGGNGKESMDDKDPLGLR